MWGSWWKRVREKICGVTGHWFSNVEVFVFEIKTNELNRDMTATLTCKCCGEVFVHKDAPNAAKETTDERK